MEIHFLDVGHGNMQVILLPDGGIFVYDCHIEDGRENYVLSYLDKIIGSRTPIDAFINSHRDAGRMRGIKELHKKHRIKSIWDSGVHGRNPKSQEYRDYMSMLCIIPLKVIKPGTFREYGNAVLRFFNSTWEDYSDPADQSIVMKIEYKDTSVMLAGDTTFKPWKEKILPQFGRDSLLSSTVLLAPSHGALSFFDDPSDPKYYFTSHMEKISPVLTLVSVGPNAQGLPHSKALELYDMHSIGSTTGNKVYTTAERGTMKLEVKREGGWVLKKKQW